MSDTDTESYLIALSNMSVAMFILITLKWKHPKATC